MPFDIIPVIDIRGRRAVRAIGGQRTEYRPLATPLCPDGDPLRAAAGLLGIAHARTLYIADLDAIEGGPPQTDTVLAVAGALPEVEIWIDGGFADPAGLAGWPLREKARPVFGSESLRSDGTAMEAKSILSLDFQGDRFLGLPALLEDAGLWPADIIVMCLHSVGAAAGPDFARLERIMAVAGRERRVYAAGGIRDIADLRALREMGAAGALIASALHSGAVTAADLAQLADA